MKLTAIAVVVLASMTLNAQDKTKTADAIYVNGTFWTGGKASAQEEAMAVRGDRIVAVGRRADIERMKTRDTVVVDLGGKFVMPGFNDAHLHLAGGGFEKLLVDLVGTKSLGEMKQRIAERAKSEAAGAWLLGRGWDHTKWTEQVLPSRQDLDAVTGDRPAFFVRVDGHIGVANTAGLRAVGITRETKDPEGGKIDRDENGEPTGILRESAKEFMESKLPKPTPAQRRKAIELALAEAARWGITSVQDNSTWDDFLVYEDLQREGRLTLRITEWLPFEAPLATLQQHRAHHPATDTMLHTGMLKGYMDGSLGSRTAVLLAPYADDHDNRGLPQFEAAKLNELARERAAAGFQLGFHAIGDGGAEMALNAFAEAERYARERGAQKKTAAEFRFRIEHDQVIAPEQIKRFRELGVIASVQPNHLLTDMNWAESRIGPERARSSYPWREFLMNGVPLAFGTDYPVEPITPFRGLYAAVTRKNEAGTKSYYPEQKLTIEEALAAYTTGAAYAEFAEKEKGALRPGMLADFVVLDRDLTKVKPEEILEAKVLRTVVGGKTVYESAK
ncbi:MAG TPA: amidohydrolase family protein [Clostridia bacterium]|nr:amidohydrolase family protein [Clostridia bacterium]